MPDFAFRNFILFFKDKTAVALSFLSEFIIVGLYILFIRENLITSFSHLQNPELLIDLWMISGILGITSVSTTMGVYGILIEDKSKQIKRDFTISPVHNSSILGGYLASAFFIGFLMTFLLFIAGEGYIFFSYGVWPGADRILSIYLFFLLISISDASLTLLLASFLKSSNALASCCTILGSLIGFLTGIYLPMGNLPTGVQMLVKCFPVSHGVVLLRQTFLEPFIAEEFLSLKTSSQEFAEFMGIQFWYEDTPLPWQGHVIVLLLAACICIGISLWQFER